MRELLHLKQGSMTVQKYGLKFTQLSRYALEIVVDKRGGKCLYVDGLNKGPRKDSRGTMFMADMDIRRLMTYVQQTNEERQRDREEYRNKKAK